jgi:hypothetical protein
MKRQETELRGATNPEALKSLLDRIKARRARQTELWSRPLRPAAAVIVSRPREAAVG